MSRVIWAVERSGRKNTWGVSSIHYTRAAARRQGKRDTEFGVQARVRKYVPQDVFDLTLQDLETRVATALTNVDATLKNYGTSENLLTKGEVSALPSEAVSRAGTLAGTQF